MYKIYILYIYTLQIYILYLCPYCEGGEPAES